MDTPETNLRADRPSRRALLRALGLGGAAVAVLGPAARAGAQESSTTTAPPTQPTDADRSLLAAAKILELSLAAAYAVLTPARVDSLGLDDPTRQVLLTLGGHHQAYAEALSALYGPGAPDAPSERVIALLGAPGLAGGDAGAVLRSAQTVEEVALDTHLTLLDALQSTNAAALVASIQVMEARHAAVLAHLQGNAYDATTPATDDGADALAAADLTGDQ